MFFYMVEYHDIQRVTLYSTMGYVKHHNPFMSLSQCLYWYTLNQCTDKYCKSAHQSLVPFLMKTLPATASSHLPNIVTVTGIWPHFFFISRPYTPDTDSDAQTNKTCQQQKM